MDGVVNICWRRNGAPCDAGTTTGVGIGSERGRDDMSAAVFAFYLFATSALAGGLFTVISRNPVHSGGPVACRS